MIPRTLSATSVNVATNCLSRWAAEFFVRASREGSSSASLGTTVHNAFEDYVKVVYIEKKKSPNFGLLKMLYVYHFGETFGHIDEASPEFQDGLVMIQAWFDRSEEAFLGAEVLSCEVKETFPLKTSVGEIPFTYIFDRFDKLNDEHYRVVDYKSSFWNVTSADLENKIQARVYALAVQIKYPHLKKVHVEFDMLRHQRVGRFFTKAENARTYRWLQAAAERIIKTEPEDAKETLNPECRFCIKVTTCEAVASNAAAKGILSLDLDGQIDRFALLTAQKAAIETAIGKLEEQITLAAKADEWFERETEDTKIAFKTQRRKYVDSDMVAQMLPDELWRRYSATKITMTNFNQLLSDPAVDDALRARLRGMVHQGFSEPKLKAEFKKGIEDE